MGVIRVFYDDDGKMSRTPPANDEEWPVSDLPVSRLVLAKMTERKLTVSELAARLEYPQNHEALGHLRNLLSRGICVKRLKVNLPRILDISAETFLAALEETKTTLEEGKKIVPPEWISGDAALFLENFSLILAHRNRILETPNLYFYQLPRAAHMIACIVQAGGNLCLGHLLSLWEAGKFLANCPICAKTVYLTRYITGLSVLFSAEGICPHCAKYVRPSPHLSDRKPLFDIQNHRRNTMVETVTYETEEFTFSGLKTVTRTKQVSHQIVQPVDIQGLLNALSG